MWDLGFLRENFEQTSKNTAMMTPSSPSQPTSLMSCLASLQDKAIAKHASASLLAIFSTPQSSGRLYEQKNTVPLF
jgi:hypothetical protein